MAVSARTRARIYSMLDSGKTTSQIASAVRLPVASVAAYRANWSRKLDSKRSRSSRTSSSSEVTTIRISNKRLTKAISQGKTVEVVLQL